MGFRLHSGCLDYPHKGLQILVFSDSSESQLILFLGIILFCSSSGSGNMSQTQDKSHSVPMSPPSSPSIPQHQRFLPTSLSTCGSSQFSQHPSVPKALPSILQHPRLLPASLSTFFPYLPPCANSPALAGLTVDIPNSLPKPVGPLSICL